MNEYQKFCCTYKNFEENIGMMPPYDIVTSVGLVGLFKLAFEQSWKMIKEILEYHGYEQSSTSSPRIVIKTAYQAGMITEEEKWLMALAARNNVAHSYNEEIALEIIKETKEIYTGMFLKLKETVEKTGLNNLYIKSSIIFVVDDFVFGNKRGFLTTFLDFKTRI